MPGGGRQPSRPSCVSLSPLSLPFLLHRGGNHGCSSLSRSFCRLLPCLQLDNILNYLKRQEGGFENNEVKELRKRQMRNFFLCFMVSQGVLMFYMGDECGHTKEGNNNTYCRDSSVNYFLWDKKEEASSDFYRFCRLMINFRREREVFRPSDLLTGEMVQWHGQQLLKGWMSDQ